MYLDELKKILHEGFLIRTQFGVSDYQQYNIIRSIYDDTIIINLNRSIGSSVQIPGQDIQIRVCCPEAEYVSKGNILDISSSFPLTAKVKLHQVSRYINHRRFERHLTDFGCIIKDSRHGIGIRSFVRNISSVGLYMESDIELEPGIPVKLDILASEGTVLCLNGEVIRKDDLGGSKGYGVQLRENSSENLINLNLLVKQLEDIELSLLDEWQKSKELSTLHTPAELNALVVDDIKFTRTYIKSIILSCGITEIHEASNGNEAIQKISIYNPDIITLDISMPGIDGIEVLRHIKNLNYTPQIIVISAFSDDYSDEKLTPLGVRHILPKPFEEARLRDLVSIICKEALS